jgi:hypothetical protein
MLAEQTWPYVWTLVFWFSEYETASRLYAASGTISVSCSGISTITWWPISGKGIVAGTVGTAAERAILAGRSLFGIMPDLDAMGI